MKYELCFNNNCLDLPSLTKIQCKENGCSIHEYMGHVILESMIWFDLIWIDIPNLTENNIDYGKYSFKFTADLRATSTFYFISFPFSRLRCSCSRKCHSKNVDKIEKLEKLHFSPSQKENTIRISTLYSRKYGKCDIGKYDLIWFDLIWFDLIWFDLIWFD